MLKIFTALLFVLMVYSSFSQKVTVFNCKETKKTEVNIDFCQIGAKKGVIQKISLYDSLLIFDAIEKKITLLPAYANYSQTDSLNIDEALTGTRVIIDFKNGFDVSTNFDTINLRNSENATYTENGLLTTILFISDIEKNIIYFTYLSEQFAVKIYDFGLVEFYSISNDKSKFRLYCTLRGRSSKSFAYQFMISEDSSKVVWVKNYKKRMLEVRFEMEKIEPFSITYNTDFPRTIKIWRHFVIRDEFNIVTDCKNEHL